MTIPQLTAEEVSQELMLSCSDYWGPEHQGSREIRPGWESLMVLPPQPRHRALHWATGGVAGVLMVKHLFYFFIFLFYDNFNMFFQLLAWESMG